MTTFTSAAAASSQKNGCTSGFLTPVEKAKRVLGASFREDLEAHLLHGYVFSTPDLFAMGRPCPKGAEVFGPWRQWSAAECDALFIWCAVGELSALAALVPAEFVWLGWVRIGREWPEIHWMRTAALRRRAYPSEHSLLCGLAPGSAPSLVR